ncbi:MAG TPA: DUF2807 domain-containing protein [Caulobacteraceae bacterium]|jgi:hypothetical protein|nr:DUF2807 domain-containing protein [Caulobacteraceae bacterium]
MTRTLFLIAVVGFLMAVICFCGATALGGRELLQRGWTVKTAHISIDDDMGRRSAPVDGGGPTETRDIAWSGADALEVEVPADVTFTQGPGPAKLTVTGPKGTVDQLRLSGPDLDFDQPPVNARPVTIVMTAPHVRRFVLDGAGAISIAGFDQDELELELNGDGRIKADGKARAVRLEISGDGQADLAGLKVDKADVDISGDGRTSIAPTRKADLDISGDGEIDLLTHPADLHSETSGDGRIVQGDAAAAAISRRR